jgi:hypothetical protein
MTDTHLGPPQAATNHTTNDDTIEHPPLYTYVETWVNAYFTPMFLHRVADGSRHRWCTRWWDHAEAIGRLTLLWTTWEPARWDPSAKASWWLELDHHLPLLLAPDGPFSGCRPAHTGRAAKHEPAAVPAIELAPPRWWD